MKTPISAPAAHAHHDRVLVARFAADDAYPAELDQARALVASCATCAEIARDIQLLSAAAADVGAPARPREFTISPEQAHRLRGSALERALRRLAAPGLAPVRPLAGVALSLGLMLAVVGGAMPAGESGGVLMSEADPRIGQEMFPANGPAVAPGAQPQTDHNFGGVQATQATDGLPRAGEAPTAEDSQRMEMLQATDRTRDVLIYAGLAIALLSLAVLLLVIAARRRIHDPLLR